MKMKRTLLAALTAMALAVTGAAPIAASPEDANEAVTVTLSEVTADTDWYTDNPDATEYTISTAEELYGLAELVNEDLASAYLAEYMQDSTKTYMLPDLENVGIFYGKTITLANDITVTDWTTPIGYLSGNNDVTAALTTAAAFTGTFDGAGHTISISGTNGLFGLLAYGATVKDLTLDVNIEKTTDVTTDTPESGIAGLAVAAVFGANVDNVTVNGSITASYTDAKGYADAAAFINRAGKGLKGDINITNCTNNATAVGHDRKAAGFAISINSGYSAYDSYGINGTVVNIENCVNNGKIEAYQDKSPSGGEVYAAGFTAWNSGILNMTDCVNNGEIYGERTVDGYSTIAVGGISACAWTSSAEAGTCVATYNNVTNNGELTAINSANIGTQSGHNVHIGGIVGMVNPGAVVYITDATSAGAINGSITNSDNTSHSVNAGGLVGQQNSSTIYVYSAIVTADCVITVSNPNQSATANNVGVYVGNAVKDKLYLYDVVNYSSIEVTGNGDLSTADVTEAASTIDVVFEETGDENVYNINLVGNSDTLIYRFSAAELQFELDADASIGYEIAAADKISLIDAGDGLYEFNYSGTDDINDATAYSITIGTVTFTGVGTVTSFGIVNDSSATDKINKVQTAVYDYDSNASINIDNNVVRTYTANGTLTDDLDISDKIENLTLSLDTTDLTINVMLPNTVNDNAYTYESMTIGIDSLVLDDITAYLGSGSGYFEDSTGATVTEDVSMTYYAAGATDNPTDYACYSVTVPAALNYAVTLTFKGDGYRTYRATVVPTDEDGAAVTVWNNVMDDTNAAAVAVGCDDNGDDETVTFLAGDICMNNVIDLYDLSAVVSYFGKTGMASDSEAYASYIQYDLNRDGKIDSKDIAMVLISWGK